nr:uncharacterized protein LOC121502712 [Drosophila kikkawai]
MIHHYEDPGVSLLRPRIFAKEVDVQLLERPLRLYPLSDPHHHPVIRGLRLLTNLTSSDELADLQHHPRPVELPPQDLQSLPHSAVSCLGIRMGSLNQAVGQTLWYPKFPCGSFHFVIQRCRGDSLEDETVLDPKIRKLGGLETQQLCRIDGDLLHASRKRVCHHVLAALPVLDVEVESLELQRSPGQAS